jgi:DNA helicase-2/ATP-dependent DNA helicase PcrA
MIELSSAQRNAVEYLDGPQIILAGAGSGKTRVIVARAQYLIEQKGFSPDSIYVITYSTKTQAELEERMSVLGDHQPPIKTFHSFGLDLVSEFNGYLRFPGEPVKADEHRLWQYRKLAIAELIESDLLDNNRPEQIYGEIKTFIDRAKDELITPEEVIAGAEKKLAAIPVADDDDTVVLRDRWTRVLEAGKIYQSYERIKSENGKSGGGGIDYGDMIVLAHKLLSGHKVVRATVRKRCRHILVDEFQDANFAQVEILRLAASDSCSVTVVGDDDQAIYRFRGASFASFKLFQKLFPGYRIFRLEKNYRSQENIVRTAQAVIEVDPGARFDPGKKMLAAKPGASRIILRKCPDDYTEALSVANEIEKLLQDENCRKPSSIAVLFRLRRHKDILARILERKRIDYRYDQQSSELATRPALLLLSLYQFAVDDTRADLIPQIMAHFVRLRPEVERDINYKLSRSGYDPLTVLTSFVTEHGEAAPLGLEALIALLERLKSLAAAETRPLELFERIAVEAGIFKDLVGERIDHQAAREISRLLQFADKFQTENDTATHASFLEYLDWQGSVSEGDIDLGENNSPVILQTVHGSKGLEYPVVFVIGLSNQRFPPRKHNSYLEFPEELYKEELPSGDYRIQEERRLFYVAMTRAMERLYLYGVEKKGLKISPFVTELAKSPAFTNSGEYETVGQSAPEFEIEFGPEKIYGHADTAILIPGGSPDDKAIANGLFDLWQRESAKASDMDEFAKFKEEFVNKLDNGIASFKKTLASDTFHPPEMQRPYRVGKISYTDIEAFKDCPLKFYFRKVLNLPSPSKPQQSMGSVIHHVLEEAGQILKSGKTPSLEELVSSFETRWRKTFLGDPDRKERLRLRGHDLLQRFLAMQSRRQGIPIETEKSFSFEIAPAPEGASPRLSGRIDRIDKTDEGLEVIDYKTGKSKSANLKSDLQLPIYSLACHDLFGEYPSRVIYMFLGDDVQHSAFYDPDSLENVRSEIMGTIDDINKSNFVATPGYVCDSCDFNRICPARKK